MVAFISLHMALQSLGKTSGLLPNLALYFSFGPGALPKFLGSLGEIEIPPPGLAEQGGAYGEGGVS